MVNEACKGKTCFSILTTWESLAIIRGTGLAELLFSSTLFLQLDSTRDTIDPVPSCSLLSCFNFPLMVIVFKVFFLKASLYLLRSTKPSLEDDSPLSTRPAHFGWVFAASTNFNVDEYRTSALVLKSPPMHFYSSTAATLIASDKQAQVAPIYDLVAYKKLVSMMTLYTLVLVSFKGVLIVLDMFIYFTKSLISLDLSVACFSVWHQKICCYLERWSPEPPLDMLNRCKWKPCHSANQFIWLIIWKAESSITLISSDLNL